MGFPVMLLRYCAEWFWYGSSCPYYYWYLFLHFTCSTLLL